MAGTSPRRLQEKSPVQVLKWLRCVAESPIPEKRGDSDLAHRGLRPKFPEPKKRSRHSRKLGRGTRAVQPTSRVPTPGACSGIERERDKSVDFVLPKRESVAGGGPRVSSNASWVVVYRGPRDPGAGGVRSAAQAPELNTSKCRPWRTEPLGEVGQDAGWWRWERKESVVDTRVRGPGGGLQGMRQRRESTTQPKLSRTPGSRKREPGRTTSLSHRPVRPAVARRGRAQRGLETGGPRVAPTRRANAPLLPALSGGPPEKPDRGAPACARARTKGEIQHGSGNQSGNLTSQPRPAGGSALGRPASAQAGVRLGK